MAVPASREGPMPRDQRRFGPAAVLLLASLVVACSGNTPATQALPTLRVGSFSTSSEPPLLVITPAPSPSAVGPSASASAAATPSATATSAPSASTAPPASVTPAPSKAPPSAGTAPPSDALACTPQPRSDLSK